MYAQRLFLRNYRNFAAEAFDLSARFTILAGHNGAGKTNALEAIYLVSTVRSFRSADLQPLIRHGCSDARVDLEVREPVTGLDRRYGIELERNTHRLRRTATIDGKAVRAAADFYGRVRTILFTPEDLGVLRGSPGARRRLLDRMLFSRHRDHIRDVQTYEKLVRSRNHVLREGGGRRDELLETYEEHLATVGSQIWTRRVELLQALGPAFIHGFARIHGRAAESVLRYRPTVEAANAAERSAALLGELRRKRREDIARGVTSVGPHRDDFEVEFEGHDAGNFASQGQARTLMLALKLAELQTARNDRGDPPILLLDDVSSELDAERTEQLFDALAQDAGQCVLTTTDPAYVRLPARAERKVLRVREGRLDQTVGPATSK